MQTRWWIVLAAAVGGAGAAGWRLGYPSLAITAGLLLLVGGAKWLRLRREGDDDGLEYDERVNDNIRRYSLQTLAAAQLGLLVYAIWSAQWLGSLT
ncbi:hypothetical protein N6H14_08335 [Paenibacillus sp. CC-CFT747]|nr:hypothetical protein N6H14_08335 [Paenibacillus sp. CC-CFT747]